MTEPTITLPLSDYNKLIEENATMRKALDDKNTVIARYHGYQYHIVNANEKIKELIEIITKNGINII